jgi:NAD+ diphosphatase
MKLLLFCGDDLWIRRSGSPRPPGAATERGARPEVARHPGGTAAQGSPRPPGAEPSVDCLFEADPARFPFAETLPEIGEQRPEIGNRKSEIPPLATRYSPLATAESPEPPSPDAERVGLRALFDLVPPEVFARAGLARQLLHWRRAHRFCGACGAPMNRHPAERAMSCPACGHAAYPRINPVVITLVYRGAEILLARKASGQPRFWSLVAGFVEPGETLEAAAAREIAEEVGLRVRNIRYAASQPWPFPNNLMLGFTAEYDSGEIAPDGAEIAEADWFGRDGLPPIPSRVSIARRLIDAFFAGHSDFV